MERLLKIVVITVLCTYIAVTGFLYVWQDHLLFFPHTMVGATPANFGGSFAEVQIPCIVGCTAQDSLWGWWLAAKTPITGETLLYLHGNGGNVSDNAEQAARLQRLGLAVLLFDYRGYGRSHGPFPTERRVYEDAESAWNYLVNGRHVRPSEIVIYGHSLGSALAVELAIHHPEAAGLIMESSLTSVKEMADLDPSYRLFPIHWILRERFDSISKVPKLKIPVLFIHGNADNQIPSAMSKKLYAAAHQPKQLVLIPRGGHETNAAVGGEFYLQAVRDFLHALPSAKQETSECCELKHP